VGTGLLSEWRFIENGREIRVPVRPRFATNSTDAAVLHAAQGGGLINVLAYQVGDQIEHRTTQNRAGKVRTAADADTSCVSNIAIAVREGSRLHRSRGGADRLALRDQTKIDRITVSSAAP
jgi:hypothetical protein